MSVSLLMTTAWPDCAPHPPLMYRSATSAVHLCTSAPGVGVGWPTVSSCVVPPEQGDAIFADGGAELGVVDAQAFVRRQAEHADLSLVQVVVHLIRRLAHLAQRV